MLGGPRESWAPGKGGPLFEPPKSAGPMPGYCGLLSPRRESKPHFHPDLGPGGLLGNGVHLVWNAGGWGCPFPHQPGGECLGPIVLGPASAPQSCPHLCPLVPSEGTELGSPWACPSFSLLRGWLPDRRTRREQHAGRALGPGRPAGGSALQVRRRGESATAASRAGPAGPAGTRGCRAWAGAGWGGGPAGWPGAPPAGPRAAGAPARAPRAPGRRPGGQGRPERLAAPGWAACARVAATAHGAAWASAPLWLEGSRAWPAASCLFAVCAPGGARELA